MTPSLYDEDEALAEMESRLILLRQSDSFGEVMPEEQAMIDFQIVAYGLVRTCISGRMRLARLKQ